MFLALIELEFKIVFSGLERTPKVRQNCKALGARSIFSVRLIFKRTIYLYFKCFKIANNY